MSTGVRGRLAGCPAMRLGLLLTALMLAVGLAGGRWGSAAAQDATPTPTCTPAVGDAAVPLGPAVEASPVAGATPVGAPTGEATAAAAIAAAENAIACYNNGNLSALLTLVTENFILNEFGFGSRDEAALGLTSALAAGQLPPIEVLEADPASALVYDDDRISVDLAFMVGDYQYVEARWFFVPRGRDLLVDEEVLLRPRPDVDAVTIISATAADDETAFVFDQSPSIAATDAVIIHVKNLDGSIARNVALLRLPEGTTVDEDGAVPADAVANGELVGSIIVGAGDEEDLALVGLPVGVYALVDEATGGATPLTVTEPAA